MVYIKCAGGICGIQLPDGSKNVINQYADDTTITVKDVASVKRVMDILEIYRRAAGAKINVDKSEVLYIGKFNKGRCSMPFKKSNDFIKVLGVYVGNREKEARDLMWTGVLKK